MAAKRISQETFDGVVKENIEEFCMEPEEALQDAVTQFESQGIDLSNIIKTLSLQGAGDGEAKHAIIVVMEKLEEMLSGVSEDADVIANLGKFTAECDIDFAHRSLAATKQAYPLMYKLYEKYKDNQNVLLSIFVALSAFFNGQPDIIDPKGIEVVSTCLKENIESSELSQAVIKTIRMTCIMHETNRQAYVNDHDLITLLLQALEKHKNDGGVTRETCQALRILTVDDDIRVPFGKAHDHAKMIVEEGALKILLEIMQEHTGDIPAMSELCATLSRLAVRNEFCQEIVDLGGLKMVLKALVENMDHKAIVKQVFAVLKAIAGNDDVKVAIVDSGGIPAMVNAMTRQQSQPQVCENGCAALAAVSLRNPKNCNAVIACGGAGVIIQSMKIHQDEAMVQKQACMAIRNLVARTREYNDAFLELGAEALINTARAKYPNVMEDEAKAALRDLGCKVELKELWKGEKAPLTM